MPPTSPATMRVGLTDAMRPRSRIVSCGGMITGVRDGRVRARMTRLVIAKKEGWRRGCWRFRRATNPLEHHFSRRSAMASRQIRSARRPSPISAMSMRSVPATQCVSRTSHRRLTTDHWPLATGHWPLTLPDSAVGLARKMLRGPAGDPMTGSEFRHRRLRLGWSREQLAHSLGVPADAIQTWENEESRISCPAALEQILRQTESVSERFGREQHGD